MATTTEKAKVGFAEGLKQLRMMDYKSAIEDLYDALGIHNRTSFAQYRDGKIEPKTGQAAAVERVFNRYGVTTNIWGV